MRNENGDSSEYYDDGAGGPHTAENREVGDKSREDEDQCPLLQVDKEEGETGIKECFLKFISKKLVEQTSEVGRGHKKM